MSKVQLAQLAMEQRYSKENIRVLVRDEISKSDEIIKLIETVTDNIITWCNQDHYDTKKEQLLELLEYQGKTKGHGIQCMLMDILTCVVVAGKMTDLTAIVAQALSCLPWERDDDVRLLKRCGEILYHMADGDLFEIILPSNSESGMLMITHDWALSDELIATIALSKFLPPMVCKPNPVNDIKHSGYLMSKSKIMSKWWNQKNKGDLRFDYLNKRNATPFKLDIEYLKAVKDTFEMAKEEEWSADVEVQEEQWEKFQLDTNKIAIDLYHQATKYGDGNIYFNHFYDNRMRTYVRGYHLSYQGNSHRKSMIDFAETTVVDASDMKDYF